MSDYYVDADYFKVGKRTLGLRTLYPPKGERNNQSILVDIVAVHGLGADALETWTATEDDSKVLWLRDILPKVMKDEILTRDSSDIRVLTFGYDASIFVQPAEANTKRLANFALSLLNDLKDNDLRQDKDGKTRPIIFLGHSLGGLVIKQALNMAHSNSSKFQDILTSTKAIHFYSTPHAGANVKDWAEVLGRMSDNLGMPNTSHAAKALETWSPDLLDLSQAFVERAENISITTFYEEKAEPGGTMVVNEGSARSGPGHQNLIALPQTHREMCRFIDEEDDNAIKILQRMKRDIQPIYSKFLDS